MISSDDIVEDILNRVMEAAPVFTAEQAAKLEEQIRQDWGGEQIKIAKRGAAWKAKKAKVREQIGTKPIAEIQAEHGISRATLYRCIGKGEK